ncbi:hypothetical protein KKE34_03720 [Patescibacteria group bacterium]|nr:hypothetical protein [Patescibacteria group bacterium]
MKQNNFLVDFIEQEMYLQNPPLKTDKFIEYCKKRGVNTTKEELEFFEKEKLFFPIARIDRPVGEEERIKFKKSEGKEYWRPAKDKLQDGETEIERYKVKFYSTYDVFKEDIIGTYHKELLKNWLEEGCIFDPTDKDFQEWNTFFGEELEHEKQKIVSFYSSFQIYWLEILKKSFSITLNFAGDEIKAISQFILLDNRQGNGSFSFQTMNDFAKKLEEITKKEPFQDFFDLENKKKILKENYQEFNKVLKFLLSVQSVYFPYTKSGGGTIQISGDDKKWHEMKRNFKLNSVLEKLDFKIEDIAKWYKIFSDEAQKRLGIKRDDWIQLWKNIAWNEKDKLEGDTRLGIDYLQWAVMLKRIIEEDLQKEILDIDEISNIAPDDILKFEPKKMDQYGVLLRATRNKRYSDQDKNYYHDRYKRSFYLANDFGLDYQPRVMVFVEGKTEETIFSEIFEQYKNVKAENLGIEFVDIGGISKFFGQKISIKDSNGKYKKGFISNFNHLISYNLNKWQIIPFFIGDNENDINHLLQNGASISFNQNDYSLSKNWQYIWGVTNDNKPFQGKDFEMANFNDNEIATVLSGILPKQIKSTDVKTQRDQNKGIKQIDAQVENCKVCVAKKLIANLFDEYDKTQDETIFERPIFKAVDKIITLANRNHPPVDREIELKNKEYIETELKKE